MVSEWELCDAYTPYPPRVSSSTVIGRNWALSCLSSRRRLPDPCSGVRTGASISKMPGHRDITCVCEKDQRPGAGLDL